MGKKKSVVLTTLITIVLFVLLCVVAFPKVTVPGSNGIKTWNPAAMQYDLSAEFEGGHYAYYYPSGVITESEYKENLGAYVENSEDWTEYKDSYKQYKDTGLYMSTDPDDCIWTDEGEVAVGFTDAFNKTVELISDRFAERAKHTGSTFRVAVVDDYAMRVDISATENSKEMTSASYVSQAVALFANTGKLTFEVTTSDGSTLVDELKDEGTSFADLIDDIYVKTEYEIAHVKINFTDKGEEMIKAFKSNSSATSLDLKISSSDSPLLSITTDSINDKNEVQFGVQYEEQALYAETLCVLLNSAMENGGVYINDNETTPFLLTTPDDLRTYPAVYGDSLIWVFVAILAVLVIACGIAIAKMGGFGAMNVYTSVSYLIIAALCFAFISGGTFVVGSGAVLVFLAGLILTNVIHAYIFSAIKKEVAAGKTVQSAVKNGYKKTLWTVVDVYAVLLLAGIALLIGVAALETIASQIVICALAGAFVNLLWGRVINHLLFSASKDKYKHYRLVREEDEDDE